MKPTPLILLIFLLFQTVHAQSDSLHIGLNITAGYQTAAVDYYQNYEDALFYRVAPYATYRFNSQLNVRVHARFENIRDQYIYPRRTYWGDEFAAHRGEIDVGVINYQNDWFQLRFGRDYFIPGKRFYEGLLFSQYNYSYDQLWLAIHNKYIQIASYYLDLNDMPTAAGLAQRYLNGHRYTLFWNGGYAAFNDVAVYGGVNRQLKPVLFNPFILFYPYAKNRKNFESNTLMSFELYYPFKEYYVFVEWLIDDFQLDHKEPGDLEPNEWGVNITLGKNNLFKYVNWKLNYTRAANRTFNAPVKAYEKYIYKNYPIGHWLGNNFWEVKSTISYTPKAEWEAQLTVYYNEYGDEALYGTFNKDYMNYTVEQGYSEAFPFGTVHTQSGLVANARYAPFAGLSLRAAAGYWFRNSRLKHNAAVSFSAQYRLELYTR